MIPSKVYAAYAAAIAHKGQPTVILAKTVKGYGMGSAGEGQMIAHQAKKMGADSLKQFRDRFKLKLSDADMETLPFIKFAEETPEFKYLKEARAKARRLAAAAAAEDVVQARNSAAVLLRCPDQGLGGARDFDDHGLRADADQADARQGASAGISCRSCRTKAAPSAWRACSAPSASIRRSASSTGPRMPITSCTTRRTRTGRSSKKASTKPAPWRRGSRRRRRIRRPTCR